MIEVKREYETLYELYSFRLEMTFHIKKLTTHNSLLIQYSNVTFSHLVGFPIANS